MLTINVKEGQGSYAKTDHNEVITGWSTSEGSGYSATVDCDNTWSEIDILPAPGWKLKQVRYSIWLTCVDYWGREEPPSFSVLDEDTGTGTHLKIRTWQFDNWVTWWNTGSAPEVIDGYYLINHNPQNIHGLAYNYWVDHEYYDGTELYGDRYQGTQTIDLYFERDLTPKGLIYSPSRNGRLIYDVTTGLPMYYG